MFARRGRGHLSGGDYVGQVRAQASDKSASSARTIFRLGMIAALGWVFACTDATRPTAPTVPDDVVRAIVTTSAYPNLPAGMTALFQYDGNGLPGGGTLGLKTTNMVLGQGSYFAYVTGAGTAPTITDAPIDPTQVFDVKYPTGLAPGTSPLGAWMRQNGSFTAFNEYYEAGWFRIGLPLTGAGSQERSVLGGGDAHRIPAAPSRSVSPDRGKEAGTVCVRAGASGWRDGRAGVRARLTAS